MIMDCSKKWKVDLFHLRNPAGQVLNDIEILHSIKQGVFTAEWLAQ